MKHGYLLVHASGFLISTEILLSIFGICTERSEEHYRDLHYELSPRRVGTLFFIEAVDIKVLCSTLAQIVLCII